jgi:hypothetical protein
MFKIRKDPCPFFETLFVSSIRLYLSPDLTTRINITLVHELTDFLGTCMQITSLEAVSVSGPRATSGPQDVADWPCNGLYSRLIEFPVVSSDLPLGYLLQYN